MAIEKDFKPSPKQDQIFKLFEDELTTEVVYGGSLGSGKSYLLASMLVMKCLTKPGIRIGLARNTITNLKKTTVVSLMEVFQDWGLSPAAHYTYNSQAGVIKFENGSEIVLVELTYLPSDPQFTRLGGMLLTFGVIDEATEVDEQGKTIFQTRLGRWKNDELGVKPFLLMTCNPSKSSFIYRDFYIPNKENRLKPHQKFVQALPTDNPYISESYLNNLSESLSLTERKRLLFGEWELEDSPNSLFKSEDVQLMFDTSIKLDSDKTMRMSCDVAFTSDQCVILIWQGSTVIKTIKPNNTEEDTLIETIKKLATEYKVKTSNICWDADGVGKYLKQHFPSGYEIHNGAKPIQNKGYSNLKAELFFKLSELVEAGQVKVEDSSIKREVTEELAVIKHRPKESMNSKIELVSKGLMKRELGHSPDIADALAYGMIFHLRNTTMTSSDFVFINM